VLSDKEKRDALKHVGKMLLLLKKVLMAVLMQAGTHVGSHFPFSCELCFGCMFFGSTWWNLDKTTIIA